MTKAEIRSVIEAKKKKVGFHELNKRSSRVIQNIQSLELFRVARAVGLYMPLSDEVDLTPLFQRLEKKFFIPAFNESENRYQMALRTPDLRKGKFGILEPTSPIFAKAKELDLIFVPGIAFTRLGRRVGRGGGFYDRLLPLYNATRIGIGFDFQWMEHIPVEAHDSLMDIVITESFRTPRIRPNPHIS